MNNEKHRYRLDVKEKDGDLSTFDCGPNIVITVKGPGIDMTFKDFETAVFDLWLDK